jgi:hypothetical protein
VTAVETLLSSTTLIGPYYWVEQITNDICIMCITCMGGDEEALEVVY